MSATPGFRVLVRDDGLVRRITLSNPPRRNAITIEGFDAFARALDDFEESAMRVAVITGDGDDFCSGADLASTRQVGSTSADNAALMRHPAAAAAALHRVTKPTVAAVDGVAMGAGMNLALGCDVVYASSRARFAELFVRRALVLDFGGTWLLPRLVGAARARELALTGREVGADEALDIGLVARVVAPGDLMPAVGSLCEQLLAGAPLAQRFTKAALARSSAMTFEQSLSFESQVQAVLLTTADFAEAVDAFVEKRPPQFGGG